MQLKDDTPVTLKNFLCPFTLENLVYLTVGFGIMLNLEEFAILSARKVLYIFMSLEVTSFFSALLYFWL